ncbi:MAG: hypothetical protein AAGI25_17880 [Bacteroidota bacterium]
MAFITLHNQEVIIREDDTINAQSTIEWLNMAIGHYQDKKCIYCICDHG